MDATAETGRNAVSERTRFSPSVENEQAGWRGTGRPNPSRETKVSGADVDRDIFNSLFGSPQEGVATLPS